MLSGPLPIKVDHRKLARQGQTLKCSLPKQQFVRFSEILAEDDGDIDVELLFSKGKQDRTQIHGSLSTIIKLVCQNCLKPFSFILECPIDLEIVANESEVAGVVEGIDVIVANDSEIKLAEILEDELIMSVPMIPRHPQVRCPDNDYEQQDVKDLFGENLTIHRPFAGLAAAIKQKDTKES
jgi:uncharacterized protein